MVLDFDTDALFGNPTYQIHSPLHREINSKDIKVLKKYCKSRYEYLVEHKFSERMQDLKLNWDQTKAGSLDKDFQRACHQALKKCKKKPNIAYVKEIS